MSEPYLDQRRYTDRVERDGLAMTFTSMHRPLGVYTSALFANGMSITALTEGGSGPSRGSSRSARTSSPR